MSRVRTYGERDVRKAYILTKSHAGNLAELHRDPLRGWWLGNVCIGVTCRDAVQFLTGLRAGLLAAPFIRTSTPKAG